MKGLPFVQAGDLIGRPYLLCFVAGELIGRAYIHVVRRETHRVAPTSTVRAGERPAVSTRSGGSPLHFLVKISALSAPSVVQISAVLFFDRHVVGVVAEIRGSNNFQSLGAAPLLRAGDSDNRDAEAITQPFGGNRLAGIHIQDRQQIRHCHLEFVVDAGGEMLVLEAQLQLLPGVFVDAFNHGVAFSEAGFGAPLDISDFPLEYQETAHRLPNRLHRLVFFQAGAAHDLANLFRQRDRARYRGFAQLGSGGGVERDHRHRAHVDRDAAGEGLGPEVADRLHQDRVAALIGHGEGRRRDAVNRMRDHLQLGEGAPHSIAIDHRHTQAGGAINRHDRVQTAGFNAHRRFDRLTDVLAHRPKGIDDIIAVGHLFDHHGRRPHHRRRHNQVVIIQLVQGIQLDRSIIADGLPRHQLADVGIAAAARAQDGRAESEVFEDSFIYDSHFCPPTLHLPPSVPPYQ